MQAKLICLLSAELRDPQLKERLVLFMMHLHTLPTGDQEFWDILEKGAKLTVKIATNRRVVKNDLINFVDALGAPFWFREGVAYNLYKVVDYRILDDASMEDLTLQGSDIDYKEYHEMKLKLVRLQ